MNPNLTIENINERIPGEIITYDYRKSTLTEPKRNLKILQWNIERGYKFNEILLTLEKLNPDIAIIQEVDIFCERSENTNQLKTICERLGWLGGLIVEFSELKSPLRKKNTQGGGLHGNAIFSKFNMNFEALIHQQQTINWEKYGENFNEPRFGGRSTLVSQIELPWGPKIQAYSVHLECFGGIIGRVTEFSEIMAHSKQTIDLIPNQVIFGDFNTLGHGIARLSPKYCQDSYRWKSLGYSESEWFHQNVLDCHSNFFEINDRLDDNEFNEEIRSNLVNIGFWDPFSRTQETTFNNRVFGLDFEGKLDWTLVKGFKVFDKSIGNEDYKESDHKWLMLNLEIIENPEEDREFFKHSYHYQASRVHLKYTLWDILFIASLPLMWLTIIYWYLL